MLGKESLGALNLPDHLRVVCDRYPSLSVFESEMELYTYSCGPEKQDRFEVCYDLDDGRTITEASVSRVRNGISVNYTEAYMRRRDPDCVVVADDLETDKSRYQDRFGEDFGGLQQPNLLLRQIEQTPRTRYILTPNQYVGVWQTGFMPQWLARDYLARRGNALYQRDQLNPARCPLLGYALKSMRIEGVCLSHGFLQVEMQPEVGEAAYDRGAAILRSFFQENLQVFLQPGLSTLGRWIIECFMEGGTLEDYEKLMPESQAYLFEV